jgi:intracellular septation protein
MKQFLEFVPIALFFIVYQYDGTVVNIGDFQYTLDGIFSATAVLIVATILQVLLTWLIAGEVEKRLWVMCAVVIVVGAATLMFRNELFIQWKPTIFNWALALIFIGARLMGKKTLLERAMGEQLELPAPVWQKLNTLWVVYFIVLGILNLVVAYNFSEAFWVSYKLYSAIGFTIALSVVTVIMISPHISEEDLKEK